MTELDVYWILQLDQFRRTASGVAAVGALLVPITIGGVVFVFLEEAFPRRVRALSVAFAGLIFAVWFSAIGAVTFLPTTQTMAAVKLIPVVVNSEEAREFTGETYELLRGMVRQKLEEIGAGAISAHGQEDSDG